MVIEGVYRQGTVVFETPPPLPEGVRVRVEAVPTTDEDITADSGGTLTALLKYAGVVKDLPPDMARNHDHYIHGSPKR